MTNEKIVELIQSGNKEYMLNLYLKNKGLIYKIARSISRKDVDDLCQEGYFALETAAIGFDTGKGIKFSSYAYKIIERHMVRYIIGQNQMRIPEYLFMYIVRYNTLMIKYKSYYGFAPDDDYMRSMLGVSSKTLSNIKKYMVYINMLSIDKGTIISDDDSIPVIVPDKVDYAGKVVKKVADEELSKVLWNIVSTLSEKQQFVIINKYRCGLSVKQISDKLGCSYSNTVVHEKNALRALKVKCRKAYIDEFIYGIGVSKMSSLATWKNTGTSSTEYTALKAIEKY